MGSQDFSKIYKKYSHLLFFVTKKYSIPDQEGDELVQEAFLRLFKNIEKVEPEKIKNFLLVTTRNLIIDRSRKAETKKVEAKESFDDFDQKSLWVENDCSDFRLEFVSSVMEDMESVADFDLFREYYSEGLTTVEIAAKRNIPKGTVRAKIHRFREKFKARVREKIGDDY